VAIVTQLFMDGPLEDFCAVHFGAPEINVVRETVRAFIDDRLARDPELKKKFDKVQQDRSGKQNRTKNRPNISAD